MRPGKLAIIVPCYNEEEVLESTNASLLKLLEGMITSGLVATDSCIVYVDDGSRDGTWALIERCIKASEHVEGVKLARNAGHQNALLAGLEEMLDRCDMSITIDADLQDDIEVIPKMVKAWDEGYDVVYGVRASRGTDTFFKRFTAQGFYRLMNSLGVKTVYNHADFRLLSNRAMADLLQFEERNVFLRGLVTQLGYRHTSVSYDRHARMAGETKYPLHKMLNFALDGITSFSVKPVRMIFWLGVVSLLIAVCILVYTLIAYFEGATLRGWASLMVSVWFCSGVLLISLGVVGEYIGKIYTEVKRRPRYRVEKHERHEGKA